MGNKKDFSKVNTNALDYLREEATAEEEENPTAGADPSDLDERLKQVQLANCTLPQDAPPFLLEERAKAREALGMLDDRPRRKNQKRKNTGMQAIYTYLTTENLDFLETIAGLYGVTRQVAINQILDKEREQNPIYKQAKELREIAQKGTQNG